MCDLLWSDPEKGIIGWEENDRGISYVFGDDVLKTFITKNKLDLIVRAHQIVEDGYLFFSKRRLVTVFTARDYCNDFDNHGAVMIVDENLVCSFKILKSASASKQTKK